MKYLKKVSAAEFDTYTQTARPAVIWNGVDPKTNPSGSKCKILKEEAQS